MVKADPPKLSEIQVGHPAATRAAYRAADERRLRQSASTPGLPAVPQPVSRRAFETHARTPDGGGGLIVAIRPPPPPAVRSPTSFKLLRSPASQAALQQWPAWYPAVRVRVRVRAKARARVTLAPTLALNSALPPTRYPAELSGVAGGDTLPVPSRPATSHEARAHRSPPQPVLAGEHAPKPNPSPSPSPSPNPNPSPYPSPNPNPDPDPNPNHNQVSTPRLRSAAHSPCTAAGQVPCWG